MKLFSKLGLSSLLATTLLLASCYSAPEINTTNYIVPSITPDYYTTYQGGNLYQISFPNHWTVLSSVEVETLDQEAEDELELSQAEFMEEKIIFFAGEYGILYGQEYYDPNVIITTGPKPAFYTLEDITEATKLGYKEFIYNLQIISTQGGQLYGQEVVILEMRGQLEPGSYYYQIWTLVTIADKAFYNVTCMTEATESLNSNILPKTVIKSFKL